MVKEKIVKIKFITPMLGTVTKDPTVYKTYIESLKPEGTTEDESLTVEKAEEKGWTGFHKDEKGLFIYDYMVKGFLGNAGNIMKEGLKVKNLKNKITNNVFIDPRRIYLGKTEPDGMLERPLRAQTPMGPRVTLARSDYVNEGTQIEFTIKWLEGGEVTEKLIDSVLEYGQFQGLGQWRGSGGYGRFKIVK